MVLRRARLLHKVHDTKALSKEVYEHLGSAAILQEGTVSGWHVTSNPSKVLSSIVKGRIVDPDHAGRELGPGLYISAVPEYWVGRSDRGSFLSKLTNDERRIFIEKARREIVMKRNITDSEAAFARRMVDAFEIDPTSTGGLYIVVGQPYSLPIFNSRWLHSIGLGHRATRSLMIAVQAEGRFVEVSRSLRGNEWKRLYRRFDGAIKKASMGQNPEAVIWNADAITYVGDPEVVDV